MRSDNKLVVVSWTNIEFSTLINFSPKVKELHTSKWGNGNIWWMPGRCFHQFTRKGKLYVYFPVDKIIVDKNGLLKNNRLCSIGILWCKHGSITLKKKFQPNNRFEGTKTLSEYGSLVCTFSEYINHYFPGFLLFAFWHQRICHMVRIRQCFFF